MAARTPLYDVHVSSGARIVEFGGWQMPVQYTGIVAEHNSVRSGAGLFDIGHMGQIEVQDEEALQKLTTNDVKKLVPGAAQYSFLCDRSGGVIDDILIYRLADRYLVIANASNAQAVFEHFKKHTDKADLMYGSMTALALQGPSAISLLQKFTDFDLSSLRHRGHAKALVSGVDCLISRSGYTGEDGAELFFPKTHAEVLWDGFIGSGAVACGLGARDTLRLEAGLPLYGHELDLNTTPLEAGLSFAVSFDKTEYLGKEALAKQRKESVKKKLIGFEVTDRMIPRQGYKLFCADREAGVVTSGTLSPTLGKALGMGYVSANVAGSQGPEGSGSFSVEVRGTKHPINLVSLPFYKRSKV